MSSTADRLFSARDTLVHVWERHSHREGLAYSTDARDEIESVCEDVDFESLSDEDAALLRWLRREADTLAEGNRDLDDCRLLIDVIEFRLYHVLRGADLPDETHPAVADVLTEELGNE